MHAHDYQRRRVICLPLQEFLAHPGVVPLDSFGPCMVAACTRDRAGRGPHCNQHPQRLQMAKKKDPGLDVGAWQRTVPAVAEGSQVSLRRLPPLVVTEVFYGLQQRTGRTSRRATCTSGPSATCCASRGSLRDRAGPGESEPTPDGPGEVLRQVGAAAGQEPGDRAAKDEWDLLVFGHAGSLTLTGISQPWLRVAAKRWAFDDLPHRRGGSVSNVAQQKINSIGRLSESLRLQHADHGDVISALGREDITAFCNRMAFLADQGQVSGHTRLAICRSVRLVLGRCRSISLTRPSELLRGLPDDFALRPEDIRKRWKKKRQAGTCRRR